MSDKYSSRKGPLSRKSTYTKLAHQHDTFSVKISLETAQKF